MPQKLNIEQFAARIRERRPDLAHVPTMTLVGKTLAASPELKEFIDLTPEGNAMPFESPRYPNGPSAGNVASDQAAAVLRGLPAAVTSIPGVAQELGAATYEMMTGHGSRRMGDLVTGAVRGVADPVITATKGAAALVAPSAIHGPSPEEWERAAEGAGAQLVAAELPNAAAGLGVAGRWAGRKITSAKAMEARAAANTSKAVAPTTLEGRATMQRIAPAAAEERLPGLRGAKIDRSIREGLGGARQNLQRVEQRLSAEVRPEFQIAMDEPLTELNSALKKLQKRPDLHADAIRELELVKAEFERLPRFASFNDVLELRRDLDAWIEQAGGFRNASSAADRTAMRARRGGANLLRKALNSIDPEFAAANRRFSLYQSLDDIVARREVGDVGKVSPALPGRGNILDDILATWAGNAVGGQLGGAALEGLNLAAQSRGWANARSGFQMRLAEILRKTPVERKLLPPGAPRLTTPDNSGVSSARASVAPATREIRTGRLLGSGARQAAAADSSGVTVIPAEPATKLPKALLPERTVNELPSSGVSIEVPKKGFGGQADTDLANYLHQELRAGRMKGTLEEAWKLWRRGFYRGPDGKIRQIQ